jgi:hypothetical protein
MAVSGRPRVDADFVRRWSNPDHYKLTSRELRLFDTVGPTVAERGQYGYDEFLEVGHWKSPRSGPYLRRNERKDVEAITRLALHVETPDRLRHRILDLLEGVGIRNGERLADGGMPRALHRV